MAGTIYWAERESEISYPETDPGGQKYRHFGATYRVLGKAAALTIPTVNTWLYETLSADAVVAATFGDRVYEADIPQGTAYPALVYQFMSGVPVSVIGGETVFTNMVYLIKGIAKGNSTIPLETAMNQADTLVHRTESVAVA